MTDKKTPRLAGQTEASPLHAKEHAWSGRFSEPVAQFVLDYTASVGFDRRLAPADIQASLAHASMLAAAGVLGAEDLTQIRQGLAQVLSEIESGAFHWQLALEDVHLNVERRLTEIAGDAGKRLHTARSRNDQVATDLRLYLRGEIDRLAAQIDALQRALVELAAQHTDTIMPGYTHLQVAQPVTFGHHLLAYVEMLQRDRERLLDARARMNQLPLGAAALAGTTFPIDRERVARDLNFEAVCQNSIDAVSDRDFAVELCAAGALMMVHLSRLAEELVLWLSPGFGFIRLPDRFTTGSSIMPQKRNPDVAELARGKSGRVAGHLVALLMMIKGQPLAYNKDNQEDKEPLFDTVDTLHATLRAFAAMVPGIEVDREAMRRAALQGHATATDLADYLVRRGVAFRDAHEAVARAVRRADERGCALPQLPLAELQALAPQIGADVLDALTLEGSVAARNHVGGTAPTQVAAQVARWRQTLEQRALTPGPSPASGRGE
ncbi:MAG TPA: argininosuccinate lyase [Burkholderiaceae bacterium]|jgi:argininosuccinate lyase|nr:argininosuccinate lyase [Burkholderiaceae bacterium]